MTILEDSAVCSEVMELMAHQETAALQKMKAAPSMCQARIFLFKLFLRVPSSPIFKGLQIFDLACSEGIAPDMSLALACFRFAMEMDCEGRCGGRLALVNLVAAANVHISQHPGEAPTSKDAVLASERQLLKRVSRWGMAPTVECWLNVFMRRIEIMNPCLELQRARHHARTLLGMLASDMALNPKLPPRACAATALGLVLGLRVVDQPGSEVEDAMRVAEEKCHSFARLKHLPFEAATGCSSLSAEVLVHIRDALHKAN